VGIRTPFRHRGSRRNESRPCARDAIPVRAVPHASGAAGTATPDREDLSVRRRTDPAPIEQPGWPTLRIRRSGKVRNPDRMTGDRDDQQGSGRGPGEDRQGKGKEQTGKLAGNEKLEAEGKIDQVTGKVQSKFGDRKAEGNKDDRKK